MSKTLKALARAARDYLWLLPLVVGFAAVLLVIASFAGVEWSIGYLFALILLLAFNHGAHSKGDGKLPPPAA